jgi:hypothetical protein
MANAKSDGKEKAIFIETRRDEPMKEALARAILDPAFGAAVTVPKFITVENHDLDVISLRKELQAQCNAVSGGDLSRAESMLVSQAHTLDALFNVLAARSSLNFGQHLDAADRYMRLALKAQGQCRATLETLAAIKNPPMVFARQANISHGPQQVNNDLSTGSRAVNPQSTPTEQSGGSRELLQDARAPAATFGTDTTMATVGAVDGPEDARGEGEIVAEPLARRTA